MKTSHKKEEILALIEENTEEGKTKLANGIDKYFTALIELYPDANYSGMKNKAELLLKKAESDKIKSSLNKLIELIDSKKEKETE